MLELDVIPAGDYIFTLRCYEDAHSQDVLKFSVFSGGADRQRLAEIRLPLRYDMGSNCVLYDVPEEELDNEWSRVYQILAARTEELRRNSEHVDHSETKDDFQQDPTFKVSTRLRVNSHYAQTARMTTRAMAKQPRSGNVEEAHPTAVRGKRRKA